MPGVFLSHSSKDKGFVTKLAADLVSRGISVWLDTWEMEAGDSLYQRLFDGIDECTFLLLALSPNSVESRWVTREYTAALAKEDALQRKVILPIKLDDCKVPLAVADRLYADFSIGYLAALERLEVLLKRAGACSALPPVERELVPLVFTKGVYLDVVRLQARFEQLIPRLSTGSRFTEEQLLVVPDAIYDNSRAAFLDLVENYPNWPKYSPEFHQSLLRDYEYVRKGEEALRCGIIELAAGLLGPEQSGFLYLAADWFARIVRHELLANFELARQLKAPSGTPTEIEPLRGVLSNSKQAARFFEVEEVFPCDVFRRDSREHIRVWVDEQSEVGEWLRANPQYPQPFRDFWSPDFVYKFVLPQMVARHCWLVPSTPLVWDLASASAQWMLGAA